MKYILVAALAVLLLCSVNGCAAKEQSSITGDVVTGTTFYAVDGTLLVRIADVSVTLARLLAQSETSMIPGLGTAPGTTPPRAFEVAYHASDVDDSHSYLIWAEVLEKDELVAASKPVQVLAVGQDSRQMSLHLVPVSTLGTPLPIPR